MVSCTASLHDLTLSDTQGWVGPRAMRRVRIVDADKLRPAIEAALTLLSDSRPMV